MLHRLSKRRSGAISALFVFGLLAILAVEPAMAQPWAGGGAGGDGQLNTFASNFIPWFIRWMLVIGVLVAVSAHLYAG